MAHLSSAELVLNGTSGGEAGNPRVRSREDKHRGDKEEDEEEIREKRKKKTTSAMR